MAVTTTAKTTPITPSSEHSYDGDGWDELQQLEKILKKKSSAALLLDALPKLRLFAPVVERLVEWMDSPLAVEAAAPSPSLPEAILLKLVTEASSSSNSSRNNNFTLLVACLATHCTHWLMTDEFKIRKDILGPIALPLFISWIQDDKGLLMPLARRSFADAVLELIRTSSANKKLLSQDHILLKRLRFSINSCGDSEIQMIIIQILYRLLPKNGNEKHSFCTMLSLDHDITRFSKDGFIHQVRDYLYAHFNKTNASMSLATLRYPVSYKLNTFFSKKMFYQNNSPQQQQHFTMGSGSNKLSWLDFNSHSIIVTVYDSHGDSIATEMEYSRVLNWKLDLQQTADGLEKLLLKLGAELLSKKDCASQLTMHSDKEVYAAEEMVQFLIDLGPQPPSSTTINTNNAFLDDNNDVNTQTVIYTLLSSKCSEKSRDERVPARLNFTSFQQQPQLSLSQKVSVPFKPIASYHAPGSSEYGGDEGEEEVEEGYGRNGEGGDLHGSIDITSFTEESAIDPAPPYPPHLLPQPSMEGSSAQPRTATAFIERFHLSPSQEDVIDRQAEEKAELPKVAPHAAPKHSIPSVTDHPGGEDGGAEVLTEQEEEQEVQPKVEEGECGKSDQRKSQQQQQRQSSASRKSSIKVTNEAVSTVRHPTGGKLSTVNDHGNDASDVDSDAEQRRQGRQGGAGSTASTDMPSFKKKKKVVPGSSTATAATSSKTEGFGKAKKGATGKRGGIIDSESSGSEYEEVDGGKKRVRSGARRESSSARGKSAGKRGATATDASAETVAKSKRGGEQASSRSFVPTINIATAAVAGAPPSLKRGKDVTEEDKEVPRRDPFDFDEEEELATTSSAKLMPPPPRLSKRSSKKSSSAAVNVTVADTTATAKKRKTVDEDELEYSESEQKQRKRSTRTKKSASDNPHRGGGPSATGAAATEEGAPQSDTSDTAVASKKSDAKDTSLVSTLKRVSSVTKQAHSGLGADLPQTPTPAARSSTAVIVIANGSSSRRSDLGAPTGQAPQREQSEVRERRASISETSKSSRQQVATSLINENKTSQIEKRNIATAEGFFKSTSSKAAPRKNREASDALVEDADFDMDYDALPMPSPSTLQRPSLLPQPHRSANMPVSIRVTESASRFVAAAASDTGSDADMNREMRVLMRQIQVQRAGVKGSDALSSVVKERRMENSCEDRRLAASDTEQEGGRLKVLRNTAEESEYRDRFVISRPASVSPQPLRVHPQRFLHPQQATKAAASVIRPRESSPASRPSYPPFAREVLPKLPVIINDLSQRRLSVLGDSTAAGSIRRRSTDNNVTEKKHSSAADSAVSVDYTTLFTPFFSEVAQLMNRQMNVKFELIDKLTAELCESINTAAFEHMESPELQVPRPPELKPVIVVVGGETERELNKQLSVSLKHLKALNFKPSSFVAKMFGE